ncbi:MAG: hypothetical protein ABMB14_24770 [Myxococcota bacterium]
MPRWCSSTIASSASASTPPNTPSRAPASRISSTADQPVSASKVRWYTSWTWNPARTPASNTGTGSPNGADAVDGSEPHRYVIRHALPATWNPRWMVSVA